MALRAVVMGWLRSAVFKIVNHSIGRAVSRPEKRKGRMSVPTWKREQAATEYLYQMYLFTIRISEICANKPKKYKTSYTDKIISLTCDAFTHARTANEIYVKTKADYEQRRMHLLEAKGIILSVCTLSDIFLEICKKSPDCKKAKIIKEQETIGNFCYTITNLISGVIKSDAKRYAAAVC